VLRKKLSVSFLVVGFIFSIGQAYPASAAAHEVPIRKVFESMGYKVDLKGKTIYLSREKDDRIQVTENSRKAKKNGKNYTLNKPIRHDKKTKKYYISVLDVYGLAKEEKKEKHYRVKKGDSLSTIAKRFKVSPAELKEWNNLKSDAVVPGQHLHTKDPIYVVKRGDSIWEIAHKTESTIEDIVSLNDLTMEVVYPGQKLRLPLQTSIKPPRQFADGVFPLAQETYDPFTNGYGDGRSFSTDGKARKHEGVDIMTPKWVPIFSATDGVIHRYGWNTYGGYRITIKAKNGMQLYYAHLMGYPPGLKKGQKVSKGQLIGFAGDTGYGKEGTSGKFLPHLHFGMYAANGKAIDPYSYLLWWEKQP